MTESHEPTARKRLSGGFWRRALAALIDWILVGALVSTVGAVAYGQTGGQVRVQQAVLMTTACAPTRTVPRGLDLPAGFRIDSAVLCTSHFLGYEVNRFGPVYVRVRETGDASHGLAGVVEAPLLSEQGIRGNSLETVDDVRVRGLDLGQS